MRPVTLRARVAAASAVAIAVAVALLGVAVLARLDSRLYGTLDDTLRRRAVDVARLSASAPAVLTDPGALESGSAAAPCSCRSSTVAGGSSPARVGSAAACSP